MIYLLILINIVLLVAGQVIWKLGAKTVIFKLSFKGIIDLVFNPCIISGGIIYVIATFLWIYILSKEDLTRVYPMQSLCYILGSLAGVVIFNESMSIVKMFGLGFIITGAFIVSIG